MTADPQPIGPGDDCDALHTEIARLEGRCDGLQACLDLMTQQRNRLSAQLDEARATIDRAVRLALTLSPTKKDT